MKQKVTLVFREHEKVTRLQDKPYFKRIRFPKEYKYVLPSTTTAYNTGYVIGAFNCTPTQDLVVIPKIPDLDFVRMLLELSCSGNREITSRLHDIIHYFSPTCTPTGNKPPVITTPVSINSVRDFDTREFLLLLFADLFIWIKENDYNARGAERDIIYIKQFIEENGYFHDRLSQCDISTGLLRECMGRPDFNPENGVDCGERFGSGLQAAAARASHAIGLYSQSMSVWPFLVDMPLLFELWCRHLFTGNVYFQKAVEKTKSKYWYPDIIEPSEGLVIDCKYKTELPDNIENSDLRQVCGYGRLNKLRTLLNISGEPNLIFLYPDKNGYAKLPSYPMWNHVTKHPYFAATAFLGIRLPQIQRP